MRTMESRPAFGIVRTELAVVGMNCTSCARHVETALVTLGDVTADVDIVSATAAVTHPATLPVADLVAAIEDAGYVVVGEGAGALGAALPEAG
ncbi:heavy-metal-associated domain-containing protein [Pseudonocardia lacus]|uniref:heavy-metal-associated domain-containing protein n=1 Tax=Pseudonocardia lacus TaxID=2835865 RepID=UPI001BDCBCBD|nr:heavy metal-associated domain-containing protein [Pseudonocardia lacus]